MDSLLSPISREDTVTFREPVSKTLASANKEARSDGLPRETAKKSAKIGRVINAAVSILVIVEDASLGPFSRDLAERRMIGMKGEDRRRRQAVRSMEEGCSWGTDQSDARINLRNMRVNNGV